MHTIFFESALPDPLFSVVFPEQRDELKSYMYAKCLSDLQLDEDGKIGYTYKCLGAGFWALRQHDFRSSLEAITFEVIRDGFLFSVLSANFKNFLALMFVFLFVLEPMTY